MHSNTPDPLELPDFLRLPPPTDEERKRLRRKYGRVARETIKNPPKRPSKQAKLLGAAFGQKIMSR